MTKPIVRHSDFAHEWQKIYTPYHFTHIIVASNHSHICLPCTNTLTINEVSCSGARQILGLPINKWHVYILRLFLKVGLLLSDENFFPRKIFYLKSSELFLFIHLRPPWTKAKKSTLTFQRFFYITRAAKLEIHTKSLLRCWNTINFRFFKPSPS